MSRELPPAVAGLCPACGNPGLTWVRPFTDRLTKVNMQIAVAVRADPDDDDHHRLAAAASRGLGGRGPAVGHP